MCEVLLVNLIKIYSIAVLQYSLLVYKHSLYLLTVDRLLPGAACMKTRIQLYSRMWPVVIRGNRYE